MKKILLFFVAIMAMILVAEAQAPEKFSYQAVIRDAAGNLVANEPVGVRVSILQYSPDGSAVYSETHNRATNANGLVTMEIGAGTVVSGNFSNIDWANGPYFLKIETDVNGGTNYTLAGTQQMLSVPYALYVAASGNGEGVSQTDFQALVGRVDSLAQINANQNGGSGSGDSGDGDNEDDDTTDTTITAQPCPGAPTVTDVDGNVYNTVQIGEQCWMRENLKTTKYANGTTIPLGTAESDEVAYRYYPNRDSANVSDYGYLYNWAAVMNGSASSDANPSGVQGICPDGWHVPSDAEWAQLTNYVSSQNQYVCGSDEDYIAKALASEEGWNSSTYNCDVGNNPIANNATGFSARPAGYYYLGYYDSYYGFGDEANFWSATQHGYYSNYAYDRSLIYSFAVVSINSSGKGYGYSVRCIRNEGGDDNPDDNDTTITAQACPGVPTVTDVDGNRYNTVQIGEQCWMRENLKTTKYANGTTIPLGTTTSSTTAYRYYPDNDSANVTDYGYLYNWAAVMNGSASSEANPSGVQGICPTGWHVPSDDEWTEMTNYVSSQSQYVCGDDTNYIAKALASEEGWDIRYVECAVGNNPSANNATGFSARPAGDYCYSAYSYFGHCATFWSATQSYSSKAYDRYLYCYDAVVGRYYPSKGNGYSVRCIRNEEGSGSEGVDDYPDITLSATIYPNPTTNYLTLSLSDNYELTSLECRIFDANGKFLDKKTVTEFRTELDLTRYATGTYFVNLYRAKQLMKSFKVIKVRE